MPLRLRAGLAILASLLMGTLGCGGGAPPDEARALVPANHLEMQRLKLAEMKASLTPQPAARSRARH